MEMSKTLLMMITRCVKMNVSFLASTLFLVAGGGTTAQAQMNQFSGVNKNYIIRNAIQVPGVTSAAQINALTVDGNSQTVQYFDGLGRPIQTVTTQGSPLKQDVVQPVAYDEYGREVYQYLPFVSTETNGHIKANPVGTPGNYNGSAHQLFYGNGSQDKVVDDTHPFTMT